MCSIHSSLRSFKRDLAEPAEVPFFLRCLHSEAKVNITVQLNHSSLDLNLAYITYRALLVILCSSRLNGQLTVILKLNTNFIIASGIEPVSGLLCPPTLDLHTLDPG